jgi:hypothetical protein
MLALVQGLKAELVVCQRAGFVFKEDWNAIAHRVGKTRAARPKFLLFTVVFQGPFGHGANDEFK